jgi:Tol biopolymer transport system component
VSGDESRLERVSGHYMCRLTCVLLVGLAALTFNAVAEANYPGQNGRISYADVDSPNGLRSVNPDGTDQRGIYSSCCIFQHAWSPDGTQVAFDLFESEGDSGLFVVNADGTGAHGLATGQATGGVSWSPDGSKLVFARQNLFTPDFDIYTINAEGSGLTDITNSTNVNEVSPAWSPDGSRIAFSLCAQVSPPNPTRCNIYTMRPDGALTGQVTTGDQSDALPDWSPDGSKILFTRFSFSQDAIDLWVSNPDGSSQTQLTTDGGGISDPTWSPDGRKIVFGDTSFPSALQVMNADGSGRHSIVTFSGSASTTTGWQPILHDRPQSASSLSASLVPAFRQTISSSQCPARGGVNSTHESPLALPSCNPPAYLPGTGAHLGPKAVGSVQLTVVPGNPFTIADEADVAISISSTDVRDRVSDDDYRTATRPHDLTLTPQLRVSDTFNGSSLNTDATTKDVDFPIPVACGGTADQTIGATCNAATSTDAVLGGTIKEGRKMVLQTYRLWLRDAGADFRAGNADDKVFAQSGIYVP